MKTFHSFTQVLSEQLLTQYSKGYRGEDFKPIQQRLIDLQLLKITNPTGFFGDKTKAAVEEFQRRNSLTVTGQLDNNTYKKLMSAYVSFAPNLSKASTPSKTQTIQSVKTEVKGDDREILRKIEVKHKEEGSSDSGVMSFLRKAFPNIVQLLDAKTMTSNDFTPAQKKIVFSVIENSQKRNPAQVNSGSTEYIDYGKEIADNFLNERGSPSMWSVVWNTLTFNTAFGVATLLGRFSWKKNPNGTYIVSDKYDFKDPKYKELTGVNRKQLEGLSIPDIQKKYDLNPYEAARTKGWVDHPDTIPGKSLAITLELDPKELKA